LRSGSALVALAAVVVPPDVSFSEHMTDELTALDRDVVGLGGRAVLAALALTALPAVRRLPAMADLSVPMLHARRAQGPRQALQSSHA
jgi:hypothetical protein